MRETKLGRPALPIDQQCAERFAVYLNDGDAALLRMLATRRGIAPGVLARLLLKQQLSRLSNSMVDKIVAEHLRM